MQQLTQQAEQAVQDLAQRYGTSTDAVRTLLAAVAAGGGTMAQFYHPDLGGGGQWMQGGMTMVGDMFNSGLQSRVAGLCSELSSMLQSFTVFVPPPVNNSGGGFMSQSNNWWPAELGSPSSSGGQNQSRYAYFPQARRLAIESFGRVTIYDTLDHNIGGVQQQQGGPNGSLSFSSQFGTFTVDSLPLAPSGNTYGNSPQQNVPQQPQQNMAPQQNMPQQNMAPQQNLSSGNLPSPGSSEILYALERLGQLHQQGVLSDEEFRVKKAELLTRL